MGSRLFYGGKRNQCKCLRGRGSLLNHCQSLLIGPSSTQCVTLAWLEVDPHREKESPRVSLFQCANASVSVTFPVCQCVNFSVPVSVCQCADVSGLVQNVVAFG